MVSIESESGPVTTDSTHRESVFGEDRLTVRDAELAALIAEQAHDERFGDRVHSVSLDALEEPTATETEDGEKVLRPRSEHRNKRQRGLLGHRARVRIKRRRYAGICEDCGGPTDGSNGRAKAPKVCASCLTARRKAAFEALPHGDVRKYSRGCRCQPCRWANARRAWDRWNAK